MTCVINYQDICITAALNLSFYMYTQLVQNEMKNFALTTTPCPPGQILHVMGSTDECECRCSTNDVSIADCLPDENKIILEVPTVAIVYDHYIYVTCTHRKVFGLIM